MLAPPIESELSLSTKTFLINYDVIYRKLDVSVTWPTIRKRAKRMPDIIVEITLALCATPFLLFFAAFLFHQPHLDNIYCSKCSPCFNYLANKISNIKLLWLPLNERQLKGSNVSGINAKVRPFKYKQQYILTGLWKKVQHLNLLGWHSHHVFHDRF